MARTLFDKRIFSVVTTGSAIGVGATLDFYAAGTASRIITYNAPTAGSANTNPLVADAAGRFGEIWIEQGQSIKWVLTPPGANPITLDNFPVTADPPTISAELLAFLAASEALEIENGGTGSTSAVNALAALGAMGLIGGTFTGQIKQTSAGSYLHNSAAGQAHGGVFVTATGAPDPTSNAGEWWGKY